MADLKPCPFCGWNVSVKSRNAKGVASGKHYFVRCPMCHTEGPRSTTSEADAIAKWNKRPTPNYEAAHAVVSAEGGYRNGLLPAMFAAADGVQEASEHQAVRGVFAGASTAKAAEGWAAWCERRHLSSLSEFLIDVSRAHGVRVPDGSQAE